MDFLTMNTSVEAEEIDPKWDAPQFGGGASTAILASGDEDEEGELEGDAFGDDDEDFEEDELAEDDEFLDDEDEAFGDAEDDDDEEEEEEDDDEL